MIVLDISILFNQAIEGNNMLTYVGENAIYSAK